MLEVPFLVSSPMVAPRRRAVLLGAAGSLVVTRPARLGLDLRGGTQIVLEAKDSPDRGGLRRHRGPHP